MTLSIVYFEVSFVGRTGNIKQRYHVAGRASSRIPFQAPITPSQCHAALSGPHNVPGSILTQSLPAARLRHANGKDIMLQQEISFQFCTNVNKICDPCLIVRCQYHCWYIFAVRCLASRPILTVIAVVENLIKVIEMFGISWILH